MFRTPLLVIGVLLTLQLPWPLGAQVPEVVTVEGVAQQLEGILRRDFEVENLRIEVLPFADDSYTQQGRFQSIAVSADRAVQDLVCIRDLFIKVFDVTLKLEALFADYSDVLTVSRSRSVISGRITEQDMNVMLGPDGAWSQKSGISDIRADFEPGLLKFSAKYRMLFGSDLEMLGTLSVVENREVHFEPTAAKVNSIPLPAGPLRSVMRAMNPLVNFDDVPLQPSIETVEVTTEYILVRG